MASTKYKLRRLLKRTDLRNTELKYTVEDVRGVLNSKGISDSSKADLDERDLSKFLVVKPGGFVFNHRIHDKLGLGFNTTDQTFIFTNDYVAFEIDDQAKDLILPEYLYMWFCRSEFDRYVLFNSYGSATLFFNWDNMCDLEIDLPPLPIQQKYVAIYNAMIANQQSYEHGLEDLKLVCDAYIEDLRRKMPCSKIGTYITEVNERNTDLEISLVQGVNSTSSFDDTKANMTGIDLHNYKIVRKGQFAYNPSRINLGSIALLQQENCVISPMYIVFEVVDKEHLLPEYLMMWFSRKEFQRSTLFYASGSVRDTFDFYEMKEVSIPIPDISVQKAIAEIFAAYNTRKAINERLKAQIKDLCPILIKGAVEEGVSS